MWPVLDDMVIEKARYLVEQNGLEAWRKSGCDAGRNIPTPKKSESWHFLNESHVLNTPLDAWQQIMVLFFKDPKGQVLLFSPLFIAKEPIYGNDK